MLIVAIASAAAAAAVVVVVVVVVAAAAAAEVVGVAVAETAHRTEAAGLGIDHIAELDCSD